MCRLRRCCCACVPSTHKWPPPALSARIPLERNGDSPTLVAEHRRYMSLAAAPSAQKLVMRWLDRALLWNSV